MQASVFVAGTMIADTSAFQARTQRSESHNGECHDGVRAGRWKSAAVVARLSAGGPGGSERDIEPYCPPALARGSQNVSFKGLRTGPSAPGAEAISDSPGSRRAARR